MVIDCTPSKGNTCHCRCHQDKQYMHIAACCCPHRHKNRSRCPECGPIEKAKMEEFYKWYNAEFYKDENGAWRKHEPKDVG